jgi:hypothetical protein
MKTHNLKAHLLVCYMQKSYSMFFLDTYVVMWFIIVIIVFGFQTPYHYLVMLKSLTTHTNRMLCWKLVNILLLRAICVLHKRIPGKKSGIHFKNKRVPLMVKVYRLGRRFLWMWLCQRRKYPLGLKWRMTC